MRKDWTHYRPMLWAYQVSRKYWLSFSFWVFILGASVYAYVVATNGVS